MRAVLRGDGVGGLEHLLGLLVVQHAVDGAEDEQWEHLGLIRARTAQTETRLVKRYVAGSNDGQGTGTGRTTGKAQGRVE